MKVFGLIGAACIALMLSGCGGGDGASGSGAAVQTNIPTTSTKPAAAAPKVLLGYALGSTTSMASAMSAATPVTAISVDVIRADANGSLNGSLPTALLSGNQAAGKLSYACITNFGTDFDPVIAHGALVTNRATTLQNIVTLAKTQNLAGINLDFEGLYTTDRDAYTSFVADLAAQLHANHSTLMLSLPAKSADVIGNTWTWPYDYAALGQSADFIQVMTYDEHIPSGQPGPVAGSDWMLAALQYAASLVPSTKLLLGLPAYGYDWNRTRNTGTSVAFKDISTLIATTGATAQWDAATQSAHFNYTATDGSAHEVWYETAQGLQTKAAMANTLNLAGVSMWVLGAEDTSFWGAITAVIH
ncbi:glycosyl hydrolase family 18 protein [Ralstonia mojiangensis]|uniref:glycosyl hydrolase family 18 protein n=1 Tax=Ralstonia mojiangensis TaxID=2953895 RepID=UPI0021B37A16|nr:glycosyl hydrolase family 18 protein [Ralstonia mojiangensis]MCT7328974.1 glycosyl hydrolase family 18 protein [Ralstonia mojiangensis]